MRFNRTSRTLRQAYGDFDPSLSRKKMMRPSALLLSPLMKLIGLLLLGTVVVALGQQNLAIVENDEQLTRALQDQSITEIVVGASFTAVHDHFGVHVRTPVLRNITLTGAEPGIVLDFNHSDGLIELCSSCTFTIANITLQNERRGTGQRLDVFVGRPGSRVITRNLLRLRVACSPTALALSSLSTFQRSAAFPDPARPQDASIENVTYLGRSWPDSVIYRDTSLDVPLSSVEEENQFGGYALNCFNDTRLCENITPESCLRRKTANECVDDLADQVADGGGEEDTTTTQGPMAAPARNTNVVLITAIVVSLVVAGAMLAALVAVVVRRHMSLLASQRHLSDKHGDGGDDDADLESGRKKSVYTLAPMGAHKGWELYSSLTSTLMGDVEDDTIQFGELVGAGSFGRVFKGRWAGRTVAIKVIEHSSSTIEAVENEVRLMLSFNHQHLVRALHCVTFISPYTTPSSESGTRLLKAETGQTVSGAIAAATSAEPVEGRRLSSSQPGQAVAVDDLLEQLPQQQQQPLQLDSMHSASCDTEGHRTTRGSAYGLSGSYGTSGCGSNVGSNVGSNGGTDKPTAAAAAAAAAAGSGACCRAETRLVLEYCDSGTLSSYVKQFWRPERQLQQQQQQQQQQQDLLRLLVLLHGAAAGLEVLHSNNVVHGDLNAQNVLVSSSASAPFGAVAKVADLGLARVMGDNRTHRTTQTLGTMNHMAPEQLRSGKMSPAADIYAFGIMVYELYTGTTAFRKLQHVGQFYETIVVHNLRPLVPQHMPADLRLLMEHCWTAEPQSRPSGSKVAECLRMMIQDRQQRATAAASLLSSAAIDIYPQQQTQMWREAAAAASASPQQPDQLQQQDQFQQQQQACSLPSKLRKGSVASSGPSAAGSSAFWRFPGSRAGSNAAASTASGFWKFGSPSNSSSFAVGSSNTPAASVLGFESLDYLPAPGPLIKHQTFDTAYEPASPVSCSPTDSVLPSNPLGQAAHAQPLPPEPELDDDATCGEANGAAAPAAAAPAAVAAAAGSQPQQLQQLQQLQQWQQQYGATANSRELDDVSAQSWLQSLQDRSTKLIDSNKDSSSKLSEIWFV